MSALIKTIGSLFDPVLNFFEQVWNYTSGFFAFLWDLIEGLYYGFNTIISHIWYIMDGISGYSFFADNLFVISGINGFIGTDGLKIIVSLFFVALLLVVIRFVFGLIPFFRK